MSRHRQRLAPPSRCGAVHAVVLWSLTLASALPGRVDAVPPDEAEARSEEESTAPRRFYFGLWTLHFGSLERGVDNNWLLGLRWGKAFGATFVNSYGDRGYSVGVQNTLARWNWAPLPLHLDYRVGVVTGYDERFIELARRTHVLPLVQLLVNTEGRLGVELSFSGPIASVGFNMGL